MLARPEADTLALLALEGLGNIGSLHGQWEVFYADYRGDEVDATGWGGYFQAGWLFGGKRRTYQPRWGVWRPVNSAGTGVFEVFTRVSFTYGNDDIECSNELGLLTLGGNWYYRKFRVNANLIYAHTKRDVADEADGLALGLRLQYLF